MTETEIIALFQLKAESLDDCAALSAAPIEEPGSGEKPYVLVSTDVMVEGTHFRRDWSTPEDLAARLFHCNLSDLCSSGASTASECLLQLGLPAQVPEDFVRGFAAALLAILREHKCNLIGGDTFRSPQIVLGLTVWGSTPRVITRAGGQPGDVLYVTGPLGLSRRGLWLLEQCNIPGNRGGPESPGGPARADISANHDEAALLRFRRGFSRPDWARLAAGDTNVHAAIDLSDGLRTDVRRLALASGLVIAIDLESIPLPPGVPLTAAEALDSGEEYEILFLGSAGLNERYSAFAIGRALPENKEGRPGVIFRENGRRVEPPSGAYEHFDP